MVRWLSLLLLVYFASGVYIVRGNEQGLVRRCGRAVPALRGSGLHLDWPWPWSRVDRINTHAVRTLSLGGGAVAETSASLPRSETARNSGSDDLNRFLRPLDAESEAPASVLTGDKNILQLPVTLEYIVADPRGWLLEHESPVPLLKRLLAAHATELVARSGVDYVHPLGQADLQARLTAALQRDPQVRRLGVVIEGVSLAGTAPPIEVKGAFLDVHNARAEKQRAIQAARTAAESRIAAARAEAEAALAQADADRRNMLSAAGAEAQRFRRVAAELRAPSGSRPADAARHRQRTFVRLWTQFVEERLSQISRLTVVDPAQPVDLHFAP